MKVSALNLQLGATLILKSNFSHTIQSMHQKSKSTTWLYVLGMLLLLTTGASQSFAQAKKTAEQEVAPKPTEVKRYVVDGGVMRKAATRADSLKRPDFSAADSLAAKERGVTMDQFDSLRRAKFESVASLPDSLAADSLGMTFELYDSLKIVNRQFIVADSLNFAAQEMKKQQKSDSLKKSATGSILWDEQPERELTKREQRRKLRAEQDADSSFVRYSTFFRDTVPLSRMTAISIVVPGFSQLHNKQAWKIPVLYGLAGFTGYMWHKENKKYQPLKKEYDFLVRRNADQVTELDPVQNRMIRSNTRKQLWMAATIGTYIYFLGDGAINYPGLTSSVKKATTLSTIFPGAGQIYNKSYWKVPIVIGGFAAMAYIIDWNNRGYKRVQTALSTRFSNDPFAGEDEFGPGVSNTVLTNAKKNYRRNRDLAIILTGALYLLNIIDAHVDAHLKDYDISDDLSMKMDVVPSMSTLSTYKNGNTYLYGLSIQMRF